jgi:HlyD family secretion protein
VTNFQVKVRIEDHDVTLKPGLSCTADIETDTVKNAITVPMQSVTIRSGDPKVSPEDLEKRKERIATRDKADNNAEYTNEKQEKATQKEERERLQKGVFKKNGGKAEWVKVTTGIADDSSMEIKSGIKEGDEVVSGSYSAISRKLKDGAKVMIDKEAVK